MQEALEEYRGYRIAVTPIRDCEDLWDFEYSLQPVAASEALARRRAQTAGGHACAEIACLAGLEVARTEVDNLLALAAPS